MPPSIRRCNAPLLGNQNNVRYVTQQLAPPGAEVSGRRARHAASRDGHRVPAGSLWRGRRSHHAHAPTVRGFRVGLVHVNPRAVAVQCRRDGHDHGQFHADRQAERRQLACLQAGVPAVLHHRRHGLGRQGRQDPGRRLCRHQQQADHRQVGGGQGTPDLLGLARRYLAAGAVQRQRGGHQGQGRVRRGAVRIHDARPERGRYLRHAAVAHRRPDPGPGPDDRQAEPGQVPQRRYLVRPWPVDHLWRQPFALEHSPVQRGIRAGRAVRLHQCPVQGLQQERVRRRDQGPSLPLRPHSRSDGEPGRHGLDQEALLHGPDLARTDPGDARQPHRADGRRRHQQRPVRVRGGQGEGSVGGHAVRRQARRRLLCRSGRRWRQPDLDQAGPCHQRGNRADGQYARSRGHHDGAQGRSLGCDLHQDLLERRGQLDQDQAWHGEGRGLPGNPPLRLPGGRQHGLHQDGRHHGQHQGQGRLLGPAEHPGLHGQRQCQGLERAERHRAGQGADRRRRAGPQPDRRPEGPGRCGHQQRMDAGAHQDAAGGRGHLRRRAGQQGQPRAGRQPGQPEVLGKAAYAVHRRGQRLAREQLPVGLQRRYQVAVAAAVGAGGRRVDRPARGGRDQRLDLHHEQFPARR